MTDLRLVVGSRDDPIAVVGELARLCPSPGESRVQRQIALDGAVAGLSTTGDLLDHVESLSPAERGDLVRKASGLPPKDVEAERHQERARMLAVSARSRPELRLAVDQRGLLKDLDDEEREMDRLAQEAERRAMEHEQRRAARHRELPDVEAERRAQRPAYPYGAP